MGTAYIFLIRLVSFWPSIAWNKCFVYLCIIIYIVVCSICNNVVYDFSDLLLIFFFLFLWCLLFVVVIFFYCTPAATCCVLKLCFFLTFCAILGTVLCTIEIFTHTEIIVEYLYYFYRLISQRMDVVYDRQHDLTVGNAIC